MKSKWLGRMEIIQHIQSLFNRNSIYQLLLLAIIIGDTQTPRKREMAKSGSCIRAKKIESHGDFTHFLIMLSIDPHKSLTGIQLPLTSSRHLSFHFHCEAIVTERTKYPLEDHCLMLDHLRLSFKFGWTTRPTTPRHFDSIRVLDLLAKGYLINFVTS